MALKWSPANWSGSPYRVFAVTPSGAYYGIQDAIDSKFAVYLVAGPTSSYVGVADTLKEAKAVAARHALAAAVRPGRPGRKNPLTRENPLEMGPNVVGWSIAALIAGAIAVAVAVYENKLPIGDKAP